MLVEQTRITIHPAEPASPYMLRELLLMDALHHSGFMPTEKEGQKKTSSNE